MLSVTVIFSAGFLVDFMSNLTIFYNDPGSIRDLCAAILDGTKLTDFCKEQGLRYADVACWISADRERAFLYDQALMMSGDRLAFEALEIADDEELLPNVRKVKIDTRLRIAGKWSPHRYGDKNVTEVRGVVNGSADAGAIPATTDWIAGVLSDGTPEAPEISSADGFVFSAAVLDEPAGRGAPVVVSEVPGGAGESGRALGFVESGALQIHDNHVREDGAGHPGVARGGRDFGSGVDGGDFCVQSAGGEEVHGADQKRA